MMLAKGSVGFQIGGQSADLVLRVMNDNGVKHLLEDKVALGAEASLAAGPVGRDARAMTDAQLKAEILSYSRAQGLFAGIDLTGGVLKPDDDANENTYGKGIHVRNIVMERTFVFRCTAFMDTSMGTVTKRSTSSALRPFHSVTMMICVLVTSGNVSIGVLRYAMKPIAASTAVRKNTR